MKEKQRKNRTKGEKGELRKKKFPPWSDLPREILEKIGKTTGFSFCTLQFRAVCRSWRNSVSLPLPQPQNRGSTPLSLLNSALPIEIPRNERAEVFTPWYLVAIKVFVIIPKSGPFKDSPMLLVVDEHNPGFLSPRYPLSVYLRHRWDISLSSSKCLDGLENGVLVIGEGSVVRRLRVMEKAHDSRKGALEMCPYSKDWSRKAVLLGNPIDEGDLLAMVLFDRFKAWILRVRDKAWRVVFDGHESKCCDIVKFKEEIYGIDYYGQAFFVNYDYKDSGVNVVTVASMVKGREGGGKRLVVDSSGKDLYMVVRRIGKLNFSFSVFKLNEVGQVWDEVKRIGNRMFFVGADISFCASVQDFQGLSSRCLHSEPGNCIFFSKGSFPVRGGHDGDQLLFGIGKDGTGLNIGQYHLRDECATGLIEPAYDIMFTAPI